MKISKIMLYNKVYLDIDGVIIDYNSKQMPFLKEFRDIVFSISNGEVYWLTTHCHNGSTERAVSYLEEVLDPETLSMLKKVKPNKWDTLKTEGINLDEEFLWFDDVIFQSEYRILEQAHKEHCLIKVEDNLEEITNLLKEEL